MSIGGEKGAKPT